MKIDTSQLSKKMLRALLSGPVEITDGDRIIGIVAPINLPPSRFDDPEFSNIIRESMESFARGEGVPFEEWEAQNTKTQRHNVTRQRKNKSTKRSR